MQQHREGLVAGSRAPWKRMQGTRVAPVSQDAQLYHLVRGHFRILQREGRG